jgi:hypothetical protein
LPWPHVFSAWRGASRAGCQAFRGAL